MGFELKYYRCPKCRAVKLAKNLDNGSFVCDNTGKCSHFIHGREGYEPEEDRDEGFRIGPMTPSGDDRYGKLLLDLQQKITPWRGISSSYTLDTVAADLASYLRSRGHNI